MPESRKTLNAVATYNEIENLPRLVDEILRAAPDADLLVIDDNSPDGTGAWCDQQRAADPCVHCLHRPTKLGLGTAMVAGMKHAVEHGYEMLVNLDADFSHDPRHLPTLIAAMDRPDGTAANVAVDVAIGSRYVPGGRIEGWPMTRRLMSRAVNRYSRLLLRLPVRDCSGSYRCYRVARLAELDLDAIVSRGYSFYEEILWRLAQRGCRFVETPITFVERPRGRSKINVREAVSALGTIAMLALRGNK